MKVTLIYAYWPNQPFEVTWCDLPWALRDAGMPKRLSDDGHEVRESILMPDGDHPAELRCGFELAAQAAAEIRTARGQGELPVLLCGSCTLAAIANVAALGGTDMGIAWFDAHPDLNTPETTTSGLFEGMALAAAAGLAWFAMSRAHVKLQAPAGLDKVALFGVRDIDEAEAALIDMHDIPLVTSAEQINQRLAAAATTYVHLDMDVHDALAVRTNSFAVPDGPSVADVRNTLAEIKGISSLSITGFDPMAADSAKASRIAIEHVLAIADAMTDD